MYSRCAPVCGDVVSRALIIHHNEKTHSLQAALARQGFRVEMIKQTPHDSRLHYSSIVKGLLNHRNAWRRVCEINELVLVVEADFVPAVDMARSPLPYYQPEKCWCFLYTGCSLIYEIKHRHFARGHAAAPVATVIGPALAEVLIRFADDQIKNNDLAKYVPWDSYVRIWAQKHGFPTYISYRSLGEHGGIADPAHKKHGLTASHRAECLSAKLEFLPAYSEDSRVRYFWVRFTAKLYGVAKLVAGRFVEYKTLCSNLSKPMQFISLLKFSIGRLITWR